MSQYYENQNLEYCKAAIKQSCNDTTVSFVKIGYYLKQVRDRELFTEDGYQDIWKFAETEFGISKSSASRFMSINDRFSVEGNSPNLLPEYVTFSSSKLSEMLTLTDKQLEEVKPETTVKQVRDMKPRKVRQEEPKVEAPKEPEASDFESHKSIWQRGIFEDDGEGYGTSRSGAVVETIKEMLRQGITEIKDPLQVGYLAYEYTVRTVDGYIEFWNGERFNFKTAISRFKKEYEWHKPQETVATSQQEEKKFYNQVPLRQENSVEWRKQHEAINDSVVVEAEYKEVIELIYNGEEIFNDYLKSNDTSIGKLIDEVLYSIDTSDRNQYRSTQIRNGLIGKLLRYTESFSKFLGKSNAKLNMYDNSIQPDLPSLKNNNQRKEWIEQYQTWPIWIDQPLTGERYYRYNLTDKVAMVVKVSNKHAWENYKETKDLEYAAEEYYLLGVKAEWSQKGSSFTLDDSRTFYECCTNKSAMVEYLKDIQKGEK